ncbi:MAG: two-component sensor histidine kinase [Tyzzerella sp.]|nr:two-component sensor histidine kinase [Tyzzerella sp.]
MYIPSGEWVIILKARLQIINRIWKSLRFRIIMLLMIISSIACFLVKEVVVGAYEDRAVAWRTAEIQEQCTILSNQLVKSTYLRTPQSDVVDAELSQFSNIYNGRVIIVDDDFRIVKDTFGTDEGKTMISPDVITCFSGSGTSYYDSEAQYLDITTPITVTLDDKVKVEGVILASVSTDIIYETMTELNGKANIIIWIIVLIVLFFGVFLSNHMMHPFHRIVKGIEDVTEGYDSDFLHVSTYQETADISEAFNKMLGRMKILDDSRQEFVSNVSHELKTPLTSMKVLADSLLAQEDVPVELYKEFMGDITEEIERENKIINDLLSLVKMDKTSTDLNVKPENINELLERILKRLRPIAAKQNVELVFESFRPVTAEVDEVKFTLAISNLVENAIKYNEEEGWVQVSLNADHKYFYVKVADSGMGIPQESLDHIFERFYRVDKSHSREIGGTGLGLAIARNAVVMHRGAVKVHSEEGVGTTFTVRIPLTYIA